MRVPFISGEGPDGYLPVNLYFSPWKIYGRDALIGRPGLLEFMDFGYSSPIRAMCECDNKGYALCGDNLFQFDSMGGFAHVGTVGQSSGIAWMESNGTQVCIVANNKGYIYEKDVLAEITTAGMSFSPGSLAYLGGYFLAHDVNTENYYESNLYDGKDWNELDYAITGVNPDDLKCVYAVNGEVFGLGLESGEVYYNSGGTDFGFSKIPGGNIPCGILAEKSAADFMGALILLNNNGTVVQMTKTPGKLSSHHVDRAIEKMVNTTDAVGFIYTMAGHTFYVLTFPIADKTYVLDLTTKFWYQWGTNGGRWRPNCYLKFNGKHLVGDYTNGKIYELSQTTYTDDGDLIARQRAMPVPMGRKQITFNSIELEMKTGTGLDSGQGSDPKVCLDYSVDKGATWSSEIWRSIGKAGEYNQLVQWNRLGRHYEFTPRITITDPVNVELTGMYINGDR